MLRLADFDGRLEARHRKLVVLATSLMLLLLGLVCCAVEVSSRRAPGAF